MDWGVPRPGAAESAFQRSVLLPIQSGYNNPGLDTAVSHNPKSARAMESAVFQEMWR